MFSFDDKARTLCCFSHPNHEAAVYGLVCRLKPACVYLTDGGGGARAAQTAAGLRAAGVPRFAWDEFGIKEDFFYNALLGTQNLALALDEVALRLADVIAAYKPQQILCDAVEYYNPIHDLTLPIVLAARRCAGNVAQVFEVPLVYQACAPAGAVYVYQRALPGRRGEEAALPLAAWERAVKLGSLEGNYTALAALVGYPDKFTPEEAHRVGEVEHIVLWGNPLAGPDPRAILRYDWRGAALKAGGKVEAAITYAGHYVPLVRALLKAEA